jgi:methionine synthase I (cobalamin-dependent)
MEAGIAAFAAQAEALAEGGADALWIETMSAREEMQAAVAGAGKTGLPIICTLCFDKTPTPASASAAPSGSIPIARAALTRTPSAARPV